VTKEESETADKYQRIFNFNYFHLVVDHPHNPVKTSLYLSAKTYEKLIIT